MYLITQTASTTRFVLSILVLVGLSLIGSLTFAQNSSTISYQGTLNYEGAPVFDGKYQMTVTLYGDQEGSNALWTDTYAADVRGGIFSVLLGSAKPLPTAKTLDRPLWVGLKVGGGIELRPLTQLSGAPYAVNVADKAITADKIATDYVASISLDGQKITSRGTKLDIKSGPGILMNFDDVTNTLILSSSGSIGTQHAQTILSNPCGTNADAGDPTNLVAGGCVNSAVAAAGPAPNGVNGGYSGVFSGQANTASGQFSLSTGGLANAATADLAAHLGGFDNLASGIASTVVAGESNLATFMHSFVGAGIDNQAAAGASAVGAGSENEIAFGGAFLIARNPAAVGMYPANSSRFSGIFAGRQNRIDGSDDAIIAGGDHNTIGGPGNNATFSAIGGGWDNDIQGVASAIPGGQKLLLGSNSFGFNGDNASPPVVTDLTFNTNNNVAVFNETDVWVADVNGTPRGVLFFSGNTSPTFTGSTFTKIVGPIVQPVSITLTLPGGGDAPMTGAMPSGSTSGSWLTSDGSGNLSWEELVFPTMIDPTNAGVPGAPGDVLQLVGTTPTWAPVTITSVPFNLLTNGTVTGQNSLLVGNGSVLSYTGTGIVDANSFTLVTGTGTSAAVDLATTEVAGLLGAGNGGTGLAPAITNTVLHTTAGGGYLEVTTSGVFAGALLQYNGTGTAPTWVNATPSGSVTFVNVLGGTAPNQNQTLLVGNGSTLSPTGSGTVIANSFIIATGTGTGPEVDLATAEVNGTLPIVRGGTGATTLAANAVLLGGTTSVGSVSTTGATGGEYLQFNASGPPSWQTPAGVSSVNWANVLGGTPTPTANTGQTLLVGTNSTLSVVSGSNGVIDANRFNRHPSGGNAVDLNLGTGSTPEVAGVLAVANGGTGTGTGGGVGQVFAVQNPGGTAPAWINSNNTGGGIGLGQITPSTGNLVTGNTIPVPVNGSFIIVSAGGNNVQANLPIGTVIGQIIVLHYQQQFPAPGGQKDLFFNKNSTTQNILIRNSFQLKQNDAAMFAWNGTKWVGLVP